MTTQPTLFPVDDDPVPPSVRGSDTSASAASAIAPVAGRLRKQVYEHLRACGEQGATDEEGIATLGLSPSTYRPRRVECVEAGLVRDSGTTRKTRSGRAAVVWVAVEVKAQESAA